MGSEGEDKGLKQGSGNCWFGTLFHKVSGVEGRVYQWRQGRDKEKKRYSLCCNEKLYGSPHAYFLPMFFLSGGLQYLLQL